MQCCEGDYEADHGAIGIADLEAGGIGELLLLVRDERQVREVDGRDHEGDEGVLAVVLGVGEDGNSGGSERFLCITRERATSARHSAVPTAEREGAYIPTCPATSLSSPLKTTSHSALNSSGLHSFTTNSPNSALMGNDCFQRTASLYFFPALLDEAPTAERVKCGCNAKSRINRWPTLPVAPRTPEKDGSVRRGRDGWARGMAY